MSGEKKKKKINYSIAWAEARKIIWNALCEGGASCLRGRLGDIVRGGISKFRTAVKGESL